MTDRSKGDGARPGKRAADGRGCPSKQAPKRDCPQNKKAAKDPSRVSGDADGGIMLTTAEILDFSEGADS